MVQPLTPQAAGSRQQAAPPGSPAKGAAPTLAVKETYDLTQIVQDRADIVLRTQNFYDDVLIPIDQLYRQADPTTPYLSVTAGAPVSITQYTHPLLTFFVNKGIPYLLSKGLTVHCPPDRNPRASQANLSLAARLPRETWRWNERRVPGRNTVRRRAKLIGLQGGWATQLNYLAGTDKDAVNDGYPIPLTVYSLFDVQYDHDALGVLRRVIVAKRRVVSELPPAWWGSHDAREEVDVYEHWDRIAHGVVLNGSEVVKPLTPHGYVDRQGAPMVPWVIKLHDPDEYIKGNAQPVISSLTPLKTIVGHPPVEDLIPITRHLSYVLTLIRYTTTEAALPTKVLKGNYIYDQGRRAYVFDNAAPQDGVEMLGNAGNIAPMLSVAEFFHNLGQQGGMGDGLITGAAKEMSGTSVQQQTDMVKSKLDEVQRTLEEGLSEEAEMILALVAANTRPSTAQLYQRKYNKPLPGDPALSANHTDGVPMPMGEVVTGDAASQITSANLEGVRVVEVAIEPYDRLPREQRWQTGVQFLTNEKSPLDPVEVLGTFMDYDDPQGAYDRGKLAQMMNNPALPFGDLAALGALIDQMEGEAPPEQIAQWRQQLAQSRMAAVTNTLAQKFQALAQGQIPGSSPPGGGAPNQGTPPAPGPMPGAPPPGGPQPGPPPPGQAPVTPIAGMSAGAPPPVQSPPMGI